MGDKIRVLFIEDSKFDQLAFERLVREENLPYDYTMAGSVAEARRALKSERFDIVITDCLLGDGTAFDVLDLKLEMPVIFVTGAGDEETAVKAMRAGAYDYLVKDLESHYLKVLPVTVQNAIKRKRAEERLRLLESAVTHANDAVVITDASQVEFPGPAIIYVNEAFTAMTGYRPEEVIGQTPRILQGPKTSRAELERVRAALAQAQPVRVELINYRKDGSEFWVELNIVPLTDDEGRVTHWVSIERDISERKRAEEEREQLICELKEALAKVKTLSGLLPICASCKKIRDDKGYWNQIEAFISSNSDAAFSHGLCPECFQKLYPEYAGPSEGLGDVTLSPQEEQEE